MKELVYKMLIENTGVALCDSGGGSNRHWQKNQNRTQKDFESDAPVEVDISNDDDYTYTISVFHYLTGNEDYIQLDDVCDDFNNKFSTMDNWDSDIYGVSDKAKEYLVRKGFDVKRSFNTYNGECFLSQTLQGTYLKLDDKYYVLLQIHNGCDVRGGYTDAKMFYLPNEFMPSQDVYGTIDGVPVDNLYDGYNLTDELGNEVKVKKDSIVSLSLLGV